MTVPSRPNELPWIIALALIILGLALVYSHRGDPETYDMPFNPASPTRCEQGYTIDGFARDGSIAHCVKDGAR